MKRPVDTGDLKLAIAVSVALSFAGCLLMHLIFVLTR